MRKWLCFFILCVIGSTAQADWINLTGAETAPNIAEIYVLDNHVRLVLEIQVDDLEKFHLLVPDDWLNEVPVDRPDKAMRARQFAEERFQFITASGKKLSAEIIRTEPRQRVDRRSPFAGMINPFTRQRIPEAPADKRVLYAELIYPFDEKPDELTIVPPLDEEGRAQASIGFIAYHKSVPIIDFRYLGTPAHLLLDWDDPWYSKFDNPNLKRHHKSALMSFLYVEPYEVRHEILTRVQDLEVWMDLGLRGDEYIEVDELEPLKQRIGDFLLTKNPVLVDGKALKPILDRTNYIKVGITGIQLVEKPERLEISTAIVGVIVTYITGGMPQQVTVDWQLFTDQIQRVPAMATDPAGPLPSFVTPDDNMLTWTNFLKNYRMPTVQQVAVADTLGDVKIPLGTVLFAVVMVPVGWRLRATRRAGKSLIPSSIVMLVLLGGAFVSYPYLQVSVAKPALMAGNLDDQQAQQLLQVLLKNVYRAFDFRDESDVYDKLALSVEGDLLTDIYLQNRKSFAVQKAGGAQARVKNVDIQHAQAERLAGEVPTYAIRGQWTATGTVGHWGHVHTRMNQYDAIVTVQADQGHWKISALELLEEQRIDPTARTSLVAR